MTKYKDLQPSQIKDIPFTNIGAQDLCSIESNWHGVIRKEGALERSFKRLGPLSKVTQVQWRQYFVVLSQGCVYVFHDECAASPKTNFSLKNFGRLQRNYNTDNSFDILPISEPGKIYRFRCASDTQRLEWMRAFYVSLLAVHKRPLPSSEPLNKKDEYTLFESEIAKPSSSASNKVYEIDESSDDDDGYDKPDEVDKLHAGSSNKYSRDPTLFKNVLPPDPKKMNKTRSKSESSDGTTKNSENCVDVSKLENTPEDESPIIKVCEDAASSRMSLLIQKPKVAPKPTKTISEAQNTNPRYANAPPKTSEKPKISKKPISTEGYKTMILPDSSKQATAPGRGVTTKSLKSPGHEKTGHQDAYINMKDVPQSYVGHDPAADKSYEYMFDGDKEKAAWALELEPVRTFLIRDSTDGDKKILVVKSGFGLKSYRIVKEGSKLYIDGDTLFDTIQQLVDYYKKNKLPTIGVSLRRGYNATEVPNTNDDDDYEPVQEPVKFKK